jgi:lipooligosaccharide transport system permease protein
MTEPVRATPPVRITPPLRITPTLMFGSRRALRLIERNLYVYRHGWIVIVSGFFEPLFYLLAFGAGLGTVVGTILYDGQHLTYAEFVGPALLASSAMNGAVLDATNNVFFKFKYAKLYDTMLATPLGPLDVALGEITCATLRGAMYTIGFMAVIAAMGVLTSLWSLLMLPVALLICFGFAAIGMATATYMSSWQHLEYVQIVMVPMFLFSTTFYPLSVYPSALQTVVQLFPLYHGVEMMRTLAVGPPTWGTLAHGCYFLVMVVVGLLVVIRRLSRLLLK